MPAETPEFVFGAPELFFVLLATSIIFAIVGPKLIRQRRAEAAKQAERSKG